jgi:hypothetical protein
MHETLPVQVAAAQVPDASAVVHAMHAAVAIAEV